MLFKRSNPQSQQTFGWSPKKAVLTSIIVLLGVAPAKMFGQTARTLATDSVGITETLGIKYFIRTTNDASGKTFNSIRCYFHDISGSEYKKIAGAVARFDEATGKVLVGDVNGRVIELKLPPKMTSYFDGTNLEGIRLANDPEFKVINSALAAAN